MPGTGQRSPRGDDLRRASAVRCSRPHEGTGVTRSPRARPPTSIDAADVGEMIAVIRFGRPPRACAMSSAHDPDGARGGDRRLRVGLSGPCLATAQPGVLGLRSSSSWRAPSLFVTAWSATSTRIRRRSCSRSCCSVSSRCRSCGSSRIVDRFEREPAKLRAAGILVGRPRGHVGARPARQRRHPVDLRRSSFRVDFAASSGPPLTAAFVEESSKLIGLILLFLLARNHVRSAYDGLSFAVTHGSPAVRRLIELVQPDGRLPLDGSTR